MTRARLSSDTEAAADGSEKLVVWIIGAGKVGTALSRALRNAGAQVTLRPRRKRLPRTVIDADLLVLAVRDTELATLSTELAAGHVSCRTPVVHCSGLLGPEVLAALRDVAAGTAQMHPMVSFASPKQVPPLRGAHVLLAGDRVAVSAARRVAEALGMSARTMPRIDRSAYHAAAALVANGAAALAFVGEDLLVSAGVTRPTAARMLGPLLASVAANVKKLGLPRALTGPVRRGDFAAVARHRDSLRTYAPSAAPLFEELVRVQIRMARQLGETDSGALAKIGSSIGRKKARS